MKYAGFWKRALACLIDMSFVFGIIQLSMMVLFLGILMSVGPDVFLPEFVEAVGSKPMIMPLFNVIFVWLYYASFEASSRQATIGKQITGLMVCDKKGERIGFGRATARHLLKLLSALIFMVGYLLSAFTKRKQTLHDKLAGCVIIEKSKLKTSVETEISNKALPV